MPHASRPIAIAAALLAAMSLPIMPARAEPPAADREALERSLEMLRLEMKMKVLQTYAEKANFYIPPQWPKRIADEYQKLAQEVVGAATLKNTDSEKWALEGKKAQENEVLAMFKLVETNVPRLLKGEKWLKERKKLELEEQKWQKDRKRNTIEIARFVEDLVRPVYLVNEGKTKDIAEKIWRANARALYGGAVQNTNDLVSDIAKYDNERAEVESRLEILKNYQEYLDTYKEVTGAIKDPLGTIGDKAEEYALKKTQDWLVSRYTDIDKEKVKEFWNARKADCQAIKALYDKYKELDDDVVLKSNPTAMGAAKRFAILGALYNYTLGKIKDTAPMKALGPITDFLDYYGQAVNLIPDVAKKTQAMVNKTDQDLKNVRALDAWNVTQLPPGDLRQLTTFDAFGLQVGADARIDAFDNPNARFYMVVEKEVIPRGYSTMGYAEFSRLSESLAYERFINAPAEASRGVGDWIGENMFEWRSTSLLSPVLSDAYLADLKTRVKKTPLKQKDLVDLANNQQVTIGGRTWSYEKLKSEADYKLDVRADEMICRAARSGMKAEYLKQWETFKALLRQHGVAFTPGQIIKLFSFYSQGGASAAHLSAYLTSLSNERAARARGTARVGIPLIALSTGDEPVAAGSTVKLTAWYLTSDLAPGRSIDAQAQWVLPKWATAPAPVAVKLTNGLTSITHDLAVPKDVRGDDIEVRLVIKVPVEKGEQAIAEAAAAMRTEAAKTAQPTPTGGDNRPPASTSPALAATPEFHEFTGEGILDVGPAGALTITVRRSPRQVVTLIEVASEMLANLPADRRQGVGFFLYRAQAAEGPWTNSCFSGMPGNPVCVIWGNAEPIDPKQPLAAGRIDKNRALLHDFSQPDPKPPHRPFYYRVGQAGFEQTPSGIKMLGQEVISNVVAPGGSARILLMPRTDAPDQPQVSSNGTFAFAYASLSLPDQAYDVHGAHFVFSSGGWTGHTWSRGDGFVSLAVPARLDGNAMSITATGEGYSASASVNILPNADASARSRTAATQATRLLESNARIRTQTAEKAQKYAAELQQKLGTLANPKDWRGADNLYRCAYQLATERHRARWELEYEVPMASLRMRAEEAYHAKDFATWLSLRQQQAPFPQKRMEIVLESSKATHEAAVAYLARTDIPADTRKWVQSTADGHAQTQAAVKRQYDNGVRIQHLDVAEAAWWAGDGGTYLGETLAGLAMELDGPDKAQVPARLEAAAERYAIVSGDQNGAANILAAAHAALLEAAPADQRAAIQKSWEEGSKPDWWPPELAPKNMEAKPPTAESLKALGQQAKPATKPSQN